jgi:hypothetical protein
VPADYQVPAEVPNVKLVRPALELQPSGTAPAQLESESEAFGVAYGENDPVTVPPVTFKLVMLGAPTTENADGCFQGVGAPGGLVQVSLNFEAEVGTRERPLKTLEHLFAPAPVKINLPLIAPLTAMPAVVTQGLAVLPNVALTVIVSVVAVPPFRIGGEKLIAPDQTPRDWLHVTVPGRTGGNLTAAPASTDGTSVNANTPPAATRNLRL